MSSTLELLPPELLISISLYLPLPSLCCLSVLSRFLQEFVKTNEDTLFRNTAFLHGYIGAKDVLLDDVQLLYGRRIIDGSVKDWKTFCRRLYTLNHSWSGKAASTVSEYPNTGRSVQRFKVDEKRGIIACTSSTGGLIVADMYNTSNVLWSLSSEYVRRFAHVEYENGFLVFDRFGFGKEVWVHIPDNVSSDQVILNARPDESQLNAVKLFACFPGRNNADDDDISSANKRGHFRPHCLLRVPPEYGHANLTAFRSVYPYVLSAGRRWAFMWDARTGEVDQIFDLSQVYFDEQDGLAMSMTPILYVEFSPRHIFVLRTGGLQIYSRHTENTEDEGKPVYELFSNKMCYGNRSYRFTSPPGTEGRDGTLVREDSALVRQHVMQNQNPDELEGTTFVWDQFMAVHVTPGAGTHLVLLLNTSRLVIIPHWEQALLAPADTPERKSFGFIAHGRAHIIQNVAMLRNRAHTVTIGCPSGYGRYLGVGQGVGGDGDGVSEGDVRVGVATTSGIFVLTFTPPPPPPPDALNVGDEGDFLNLSASLLAAPPFLSPSPGINLRRLDCLQVSPSGVWVVWKPELGLRQNSSDVGAGAGPSDGGGAMFDEDVRLLGSSSDRGPDNERTELEMYYDSLESAPSWEHVGPGIEAEIYRAVEQDNDSFAIDGHSTVWSVDF